MKKRHHWPTRKNRETGRYEVRIRGDWVSRQRAFVLLREREAAAARRRVGDKKEIG